MAILVRTNDLASELAEGLRVRGINCTIRGKGGLFRNPEIQLIQGIICLLARDDFVLPGTSGTILDEVGTREFIREKVEELDERAPDMQAETILRWVDARRVSLYRKTADGYFKRIYPQRIFQEILVACGIQSAGSETGMWDESVLYNFGSFSNVLAQFEEVRQWLNANHLSHLCEFLHSWAARKADEGQVEAAFLPNTVQILTVHQAKGLEWPVLFLPRIESNLFPERNRRRPVETFLTDFDDSDYIAGDDGERRLWYVALTRCRKYLNITSRSFRRCKPTYLFKEIQHNCVRDDPLEITRKLTPVPDTDIEVIPTNFSDLSVFWRCPREYLLRSLMGFRPGVKEDFGYGQQVHNILAEIHKKNLAGSPFTVGEALDLVEERFNLRYTSGPPLEMLTLAARNAVKLYMTEIAPDLCSRILDAERPFEFLDQESGAMISGTIDLLRHADGVEGELVHFPISIVDFKNHNWTEKESFNKAKAAAELQLQLYAKASKEAFDMDAQDAEVVFLSGKQIPPNLEAEGVSYRMSADVSSEAQDRVMEQVRETVRSIREDVPLGIQAFTPNHDGHHCGSCDFRRLCPHA